MPPTPIHPNSLANLRPAQPGDVRNPKGRTTLGATVKEWMNVFGEQGLSLGDLRKMAADANEPWARGEAALRMVRARENPDLADFEGVLDGQMGLREARAAGLDTSNIKKIKQKQRTIAGKDGGEAVVETEREIELHDRSLAEAQFVMEQTDGRPAATEESPDKDPARLLVSITITNGQASVSGANGEVPQVHINPFDAVALPSPQSILPETPENKGNP